MNRRPYFHVTTARRRAAFLDRDGVLNRAYVRGGVSCPPRGLDDLEILPGVEAAARRLSGLGLALIVVTNQPDVARGRQTRAAVEAINDALRARLPLDDVATCYHDTPDGCPCRKPRPGLLLAAAARHGIDLAGSFMVGDRGTDVAAGRAAGCRTVLVDGVDARRHGSRPDFVAADLAGAADIIARHLGARRSRQRSVAVPDHATRRGWPGSRRRDAGAAAPASDDGPRPPGSRAGTLFEPQAVRPHHATR